MDKLLPCPFCGGEAEVEQLGYSGKLFFVSCRTPYCCDSGLFDNEADAIAAWNKRAERTCKPVISDNLAESEGMGDAWADCSECGHLLFVLTDPNSQPPNYCPNCGARVIGGSE